MKKELYGGYATFPSGTDDMEIIRTMPDKIREITEDLIKIHEYGGTLLPDTMEFIFKTDKNSDIFPWVCRASIGIKIQALMPEE